jgi:2'-5' RNA ligase
MRLFAAIPLLGEAHRAAADQLRALKALDWPVRWVKDEGLHITLKFFGEVTSDRLETISEMLGFCMEGMTPMTLAVTGAGVFPMPAKPRIIKLEVSTAPDLELLQDRIERAGERIGFPPEGRPFHPHITLGRVREGHRLPLGALDRLEQVAPEPAFVADRLVLYDSNHGSDGPVYRSRAEFSLIQP